ncbi:hypothetical protein YC2023_094760 [Brassica napus]
MEGALFLFRLSTRTKKGRGNRFGLVKILIFLVIKTEKRNRRTEQNKRLRQDDRNDEEGRNKTYETVMCLSV